MHSPGCWLRGLALLVLWAVADTSPSMEAQLQALRDVYHATGGANWKKNDGWLSEVWLLSSVSVFL